MTDSTQSGTRANGTGDVPVLSRARSALAEQITAAEELDAAPVGIVVRLAGGLVAEKRPTERWAITGYRGPQDLRLDDLPATVLYRPDADLARCARCGGTGGAHGLVHTRYGNGGGGNKPCPDAPAPADEDRCLCDGAAYESRAHPFLVHPDCPQHAARSPRPAPSVSAEQVEVDRACAWADYRKEYGARGVVEHKAFCAGWDAARGRLDVGGVQR